MSSYKQAGVDIDAGNQTVDLLRDVVAAATTADHIGGQDPKSMKKSMEDS